MNKIRKSIVLLIILIIIISIAIFICEFIFVKKDNYEERMQEQGNKENNINTDLIEVKSSDIYYMIKRNLDLYVTYIKQVNGLIGEKKYQDHEIKEEGIEKVYNVLDKEYIKEFSISKENLVNKVKKYDNYDLDIKKMYSGQITDKIFLYIVEATLGSRSFNTFIRVDNKNATFSICPEEFINGRLDIKDINSENIKKMYNDEEILKNSYNGIKYNKITDDYLASQYMNTLRIRMLNDAEYVYSLIEEEYREKRFSNLNTFKEYINRNKEEIEKIETKSYLKNVYTNYTEYICKDQNDNIYCFKDQSVMNYTVQLDDYTLDYKDEEYLKNYKSATNQYKVANNINKWVKMLNNRDYKAAYNVLDKTFRERFGNEEQFEEYMRKAFPEHYAIEYEEFSEEDGLFTQKIVLTDITGKTDSKIIKTIIMKLEEGTNFTMSFNTTKGDTTR